jgi:hypothetical protein
LATISNHGQRTRNIHLANPSRAQRHNSPTNTRIKTAQTARALFRDTRVATIGSTRDSSQKSFQKNHKNSGRTRKTDLGGGRSNVRMLQHPKIQITHAKFPKPTQTNNENQDQKNRPGGREEGPSLSVHVFSTQHLTVLIDNVSRGARSEKPA